jgi:hypothetical protein
MRKLVGSALEMKTLIFTTFVRVIRVLICGLKAHLVHLITLSQCTLRVLRDLSGYNKRNEGSIPA